MGRRSKTKAELLEKIRTSRDLLEKKFAKLTPEQMVWPGSMDDWSVKDILAHLVDWEQRLISWYKAGLRGEVPKTPAPGMTWRELPKLNRIGYEKHKDESLKEVLAQFQASYQEVLALVQGMTDEEIFEPGLYAWTGKDPLLPWIAANTSSHYEWARRNIRTTVIRKAFEQR
jgi:hypothetical protein